jgi:hypothetical protein
LPADAYLEISQYGGHCGFIEGPSLRGFAERWVCDRLELALAPAGAAPDQAPAGISSNNAAPSAIR